MKFVALLYAARTQRLVPGSPPALASRGMTTERRVTDWLSLTTEEFAADRIAVLPVAAVEQHGPHLPVGVDSLIAEAYLARVRARLPHSPALFLPVQAVGASDEHKAYPGTLTLAPETALAAFTEIGESVHRAGIRKLVIINSHGGNITIIDLAARQLRVRLQMLVVHCSWGRFGYPAGLFSDAERTHGIHGGDIETSIMLAAYPDLVRRAKIANFLPASYAMERAYSYLRADYPAGFGWMTQDLNAAGAVGDASLASARKGEAALDHGARAFLALLKDVEKFDLRQLAAGPLNSPAAVR
jgi:creatinine amidohydrolase